MDTEHYETPMRGLFPRYLVTAFLLALVASVLPSGIVVLLGVVYATSIASFQALLSAIGLLYFPLIPLLVFYLVTRVRINLGEDYAVVALSLLIGATAGYLPIYLFSYFISASAASPLALSTVLQAVGYALYSGLGITFVGFVAVLYSYYRRM